MLRARVGEKNSQVRDTLTLVFGPLVFVTDMFVVSGHLYMPLFSSQSWELGGKILGGFGTQHLLGSMVQQVPCGTGGHAFNSHG